MTSLSPSKPWDLSWQKNVLVTWLKGEGWYLDQERKDICKKHRNQKVAIQKIISWYYQSNTWDWYIYLHAWLIWSKLGFYGWFMSEPRGPFDGFKGFYMVLLFFCWMNKVLAYPCRKIPRKIIPAHVISFRFGMNCKPFLRCNSNSLWISSAFVRGLSTRNDFTLSLPT